jgi:hypothetical protein
MIRRGGLVGLDVLPHVEFDDGRLRNALAKADGFRRAND